MTYQPRYTARYIKHYRAFHNLRARIDGVETRILTDPYALTEPLGSKGQLNLKGCRSARVGRNFRIIFVICEECRKEPDCDYCYCEGLSDRTVVFLTVGPHDKAYAIK
jgi:mRNA-degrading endonuclease RelE of RelBE toxin-antitoxin system